MAPPNTCSAPHSTAIRGPRSPPVGDRSARGTAGRGPGRKAAHAGGGATGAARPVRNPPAGHGDRSGARGTAGRTDPRRPGAGRGHGPRAGAAGERHGRARTSDRELLHDLVADVVVRVDVLDVVAVLERLDQAEHLAGALLV